MRKPCFLADENIAAPMVSALRDADWDTAYVSEANPSISDSEVIRWAHEEHRVLLTEDKDFGEIVFRMKHEVPGVVLLRLSEDSWRVRWERLRKLLERHSERLERKFVVSQPHNTRFRPIAR